MQISNFRQRKWGRLATRAALSVMLLTSVPSFSQSNSRLQEFFRNNIGLSEEQIAAIKSGRAVVKAMPSRSPAEVFLFGAVYVHAVPENSSSLLMILMVFGNSRTTWRSECSASFGSEVVPLSGVQLEGGEYGHTGS